METMDELKILVQSYHDGTATERDLERLSSLLKENGELQARFREMLDEMDGAGVADSAVKDAFHQVMLKSMIRVREEEAELAVHRRRMRAFVWGAAMSSFAAMAAAVVLAIFLHRSNEPEIQPCIYTGMLASDQTTLVTLPDSTRVILSPSAKLVQSASFSRTNRKVELEGEAFFDVTSDSEHPFEISAADCKVTVKGTVFGLNASPSDVKLTLLEGKVDFSAPNIERKIIPGESMTYTLDNGNISVVHVDVDAYRDWLNGKLEYFNLTFPELISRIGALYGKTIVIDSKLAQNPKRYSITLSNHESEEDVMEMLGVIVPMTISASGDTIKLCKKN